MKKHHIGGAPRFILVVLVATVALGGVAATEPVIVQSRGVDSRVDYASLDRFGPWDDRNYQLTREDLALLAENEVDLHEAVPAFYRVALRRRMPEMLRYRFGCLPARPISSSVWGQPMW